MKKTRKQLCRIALTFCLFFAAVFLFKPSSLQADAAAGYKSLWGSHELSDTVKSGSYYFRWSYYYNCVKMSSSKYGSYRDTPISTTSLSNGKNCYYVKEGRLYKFDFSTKYATSLKKFKTTNSTYYYVTAVYGKKIFLTKASDVNCKYVTYSFNTKTKKLSRLKSNCTLAGQYKNYVVAQLGYRSDITPYPIAIYQIQSSSLKKVKKLTNYGHVLNVIKGKIYYSTYSSGSAMNNVTLYKCDAKGTNKKKIVTVSSTDKNCYIYFVKVTSTYCEYYKGSQRYRYTY